MSDKSDLSGHSGHYFLQGPECLQALMVDVKSLRFGKIAVAVGLVAETGISEGD